MASDEQLRGLEERYEGYTVYDNAGEKIGKVDDLFVDENDREEYIGVKMGLFGLSGTTLIPMDAVRVDERERAMEVSQSKEHVKDGPNFSDDDDITPEYEERIRRHFGLGSLESSTERGSYGRSGAAGTASTGGRTDLEDRDRAGGGRDVEDRDHVGGRESYRNREDMGDESVMGSVGAGAAAPSGGARDLETGDRGGVEDEGYREGYREGFREGYREGAQEGGEPGDRGDLSPSGSMTGAGSAGAPEARDRDLDRGEPGDRGDLDPTGSATGGVGATGARDLDRGEVGDRYLERGGREGEREGEREGVGSASDSETRDRDLEREQGREGSGERREESTGTKVWRRIRG